MRLATQRTVETPVKFRPIFRQMEEHFRRFFRKQKGDPSKGTIEISGERFVLVRGAALSVEFFESIKRLFSYSESEATSIASQVLFDIAHALGKADARHFHGSIGLSDPISKLSAGPVFFAHAGWAFVSISEESRPEPTENYYLLYDHPYSFEADAWLRAGRRSDFPVCLMNAGYSSGWCEESFGLPLVATEVSCRAKGDEACRFIMAPPARIDEHVARYRAHSDGGANSGVGKEAWTSLKREWTQEALLKESLRHSELAYRKLFELSPDAIVVWDAGNTIRATNRAAATLLGYSKADDLVGRKWDDFIVASDLNGSIVGIRRAGANDGTSAAEFRMKRSDGSSFTAQGRLSLLFDAKGEPTQTIAIARDISDRLEMETALRTQALHDSLTKLPNRAAFMARLREVFALAKRGGPAFAILYLDLDMFKDVNDTLGHAAGDRLLQAVADRLKDSLRGSDFIARLGGDEFAILQSSLDHPSDAGEAAARLNKAIAMPFRIDDDDVHVTVSIGIALYSEDVADPEAMLTQADLALYRAKSEGRDRYCFHIVSLDRDVRERVVLANELRAALANNELRLHYQPQVELVSGRIVGVEALVRWSHPSRGMLMPADFIHVAEATGAIKALGRWVLEEACRQMELWRSAGIAPPLVAVNISIVQLKTDQDFEKDLFGIVTRHGLAPVDVELELTESGLLETTQDRRGLLEHIQQSGFRLSIDDFGIGYSSLNYLRYFRFNRLKIAQQFVSGLPANSGDAAITRAALGLASEFGIEVVAEGVETAEQAAFLRSVGCKFAQGYYFARPAPAEAVTSLLRQGRIVLPATDP